MPTIGHLFIGITISVLFYYTSHKKFNFLMGVIFIMGSILPDIFTILKKLSLLNDDTFNVPHSIVDWIWWALMFTVIFEIYIYYLTTKNEKYKIKFSHMYLILLSAGWIHLGLDMITDPVRLIWDCNISIFSFYTPYEIIVGEQDVIVIFYFLFTIIPFMLLLIVIDKTERLLC